MSSKGFGLEILELRDRLFHSPDPDEILGSSAFTCSHPITNTMNLAAVSEKISDKSETREPTERIADECEIEAINNTSSERVMYITLDNCALNALNGMSTATMKRNASWEDQGPHQTCLIKLKCEHSAREVDIELIKKDEDIFRIRFIPENGVCEANQVTNTPPLDQTMNSIHIDKSSSTSTIESCCTKLEKMLGIQCAIHELSFKLEKSARLRSELIDLSRNREKLLEGLESISDSEDGKKIDIESVLQKMEEVSHNISEESARRRHYETKMDVMQKQVLALKSERNYYKQKAESLTKEVNHIYKRGHTLQDIETILKNQECQKIEIDVLKAEKQKALQDFNHYRQSYQQQLIAMLHTDMDGSTVKILERNAELERIVEELHEYVHAKEMQLQTMKEVNEVLTRDLKELAQIGMKKNEI
jgi:hypothetical protein